MKISDEIVQEFGSLLPFKTTQGLRYSEIEKALSAVLPKLMVKVKELEFMASDPNVWACDDYLIVDLGSNWSYDRFQLSRNGVKVSQCGYFKEAKAAAQAYYERRILQGLEIVKAATVTDGGTKTVDAGELLGNSETLKSDCFDAVTMPVSNIECRTPQEVFDIMCDRVRALSAEPAPEAAQ